MKSKELWLTVILLAGYRTQGTGLPGYLDYYLVGITYGYRQRKFKNGFLIGYL